MSLHPVVLAIDDSPENLVLMSTLLKDRYKVKVANSGARGLELARSASPDIILLDIMMPVMDGYAVCEQLKRDPATAHIPVIFLTARTESDDEKHGLEVGAVDYITKPISPPIFLMRIQNHLALKRAADFLRDKADYLENEVQMRTREIAALQEVTVQVVTSLAETRDQETGKHIRRTQLYVKALAEKLQSHPRFAASLGSLEIDAIYKSAPLHDIGKVGIPDRILLKPGKLTAEEFEIMKTHTTLGYEAIVHTEQELGVNVGFLRYAKEIALSHQEKWDGSGYPQGLSGDAIPVSARLMAIADVYDALISRRVYKEPYPHDRAIAILKEGRGSHFDPDVLDAFLDIESEVLGIALKYADSEEDIAHKKTQMESLSR
jgi:putative two-component system response regulator